MGNTWDLKYRLKRMRLAKKIRGLSAERVYGLCSSRRNNTSGFAICGTQNGQKCLKMDYSAVIWSSMANYSQVCPRINSS
jgi:hypothetical protein